MSTREKLRKHIQGTGLKLIYIADLSGMSIQRLSAILNGRRKRIYVDELIAICNALGVSVEIFL